MTRCEHKVRAKMTFQLIFCHYTFTPVCLITVLGRYGNQQSVTKRKMYGLMFFFFANDVVVFFPLIF